ncbi:MAG: ribonuclease III [Oscillospiraceae bacterium]|nr:ribonuclease III [Oscillospiraceae bacterium]
MDYFKPDMSPAALGAVSMLGLAHIGDAVYELMTRASLCAEGHTAAQELHRRTTARVNAPAQARAAERILPYLDEEESAIYRRGRNTHVNSVPHAANVGEYHAATALEALFGWLYLQGRTERLNELFAILSGAPAEKES